MAWTLDVILTVTMKDSEKVATVTTTIKPTLIAPMDGMLIMMATLMSDSELMLVTIDLEVAVKMKMVANKKAIMVTEVNRVITRLIMNRKMPVVTVTKMAEKNARVMKLLGMAIWRSNLTQSSVMYLICRAVMVSK